MENFTPRGANSSYAPPANSFTIEFSVYHLGLLNEKNTIYFPSDNLHWIKFC